MERQSESGIGQRVRAARKRLGWTREVLAVRSEISWSAISQIESGRRRNLRPATLHALAEALGVSIDYLVSGGPVTPVTLVHQGLVYDSEEAFAEVAVPFLEGGLEHGEALVVVTPESNVERIRDGLGSEASAVAFHDPIDIYTTPDAALDAYGQIIDAATASGAPWIRAIGEPIWAGRTEAEVRRWTRYESLLNLVFASSPVTVICPYDERALAPEIVRDAHATHPQMVDVAGVSQSPQFADPRTFVTGD